MKRMLALVLCMIVVVSAGGCFVSIKGDACKCYKEMQEANPDPTIAEIDAVHSLVSESARLNVLRTIAQRPGLSAQARVHLVDTATGVLVSEQAREEVLVALAKNPPAPMPQPEPYPCEGEADDD